MFTIIGGDGNEYGPVAVENITAWIAAGRANLQTKARRTGETEWKTLGDFPEFCTSPGFVSPLPVSPPAAMPAAVTLGFAPDLADRWVRLGAILVDAFIGGVFALPGLFVLISAGIFSNQNEPNTALLLGSFAAFGIAFILLLAIQIFLLVTRGQTMGKKLLGIRIVNYDDGANPGFIKIFLLRIFVNGLICAVPLLGLIYAVADICFIFRDDQRCLHDLIAGTVVVRA